jgi:hypothetical protein
MKKILLLIFCFATCAFSQQNRDTRAVELSFLRGNVMSHTPDLYHLIDGHPEGLMLSFLKQTHGEKEWHRAYNYPEVGGYFLYQNFNSRSLGENYSVGGLYNFYFLNRRLKLKLAQGIAWATSPYDKISNSKNKAFGSRLLNNTNIGLEYTKDNIFDKFGIHAGLLFSHYSNGRTKAPNSGINTYLLNVGVNYNLDEKRKNKIDTIETKLSYKEPIRYNIALRTGVNESPIIRSGQKPFYHLGFFIDKRLNRKSAIQLGTELFLTNYFKDYIKYQAVAFPEKNLDPNTPHERVGVFVGHELFINKISLEAQIGYYIYRPFNSDIPVYNRTGMKYYLNKNINIGFTIKTHLFLAEALEFGIGVRL